MKRLQNTLKNTQEIDLRKLFPKATSALTELVNDKFQAIQIEGSGSINK